MPAAGQLAHIRRFETVIRVPSELTAGALAVLEHRLPPGALAMPRHAHPVAEAITVVSGVLQVEIERTVHDVRAGESIAVPPGAWHTYWVSPDAPAPAVFVAVVAPGGLERYFVEVSAAVPPGGLPVMEEIHAAGARHGVEVDLGSLYDLIERHTLLLS